MIWGNYFFKSIQTIYCFHVSFWASSKLILTFTKWGGVACETTSVYGQQLLSTSASPHAYVRTICFQHEWAKNVSNHCKTNNGYDFKFTKFSVNDFFLIDRRNLVRYASKNAKKNFALSREKRHWYQSHWRRNFRFFFSYFGFLHLLGNLKRLCPSKNF